MHQFRLHEDRTDYFYHKPLWDVQLLVQGCGISRVKHLSHRELEGSVKHQISGYRYSYAHVGFVAHALTDTSPIPQSAPYIDRVLLNEATPYKEVGSITSRSASGILDSWQGQLLMFRQSRALWKFSDLGVLELHSTLPTKEWIDSVECANTRTINYKSCRITFYPRHIVWQVTYRLLFITGGTLASINACMENILVVHRHESVQSHCTQD